MSSEKKNIGEYYLGLDIGTDSVGWCVTDPNYNILKAKGKAMWGIRLFDAANSAADRRTFRGMRRRLHRRNDRVKLVRELLRSEIEKVDPHFFTRLDESKFLKEDKKDELKENTPERCCRFTLFANPDCEVRECKTDKEYHHAITGGFPTIYHLRVALMEHKRRYDIRLYYIAISHFMKHRGHFLFDGDFSEKADFDKVFQFEEVFRDLQTYANEQMGVTFDVDDIDAVKTLLCDKKTNPTDKNREIVRLFEAPGDKRKAGMQKEAIKALCGLNVQLAKLFGDDDLKNAEIKVFSFEKVDEEDVDKLVSVLGDQFEFFQKLKAVYDWTFLNSIMDEYSSISKAQVARYEKHRSDLKDLKNVFRGCVFQGCLTKEEYDAFFSGKDNGKSRENKDGVTIGYDAYSGHASGKVDLWKKRPEQADFCDGIKKIFEKIDYLDDKHLTETLTRIKSEVEEGKFMPKQVSKINHRIPYQIHKRDLSAILDALREDYPVFDVKDVDGLTICKKLMKIFEFQIPYYVGPLNTYHSDKGGNSWMKRKEGQERGEIRPWNFYSKVDCEKTAEIFMERLTSKCTYLHDQYVLPKNSLLYSKFMVLNELNNVRIDGDKLSSEDKKKIFEGVFKTCPGKITKSNLKTWWNEEKGIEIDEDQIGGIDETFQGTLKSYQDFVRILDGEKRGKARVDADPTMIEDIIRNVVIFGNDKEMLYDRIYDKYGDKLSKEEIEKIKKLSYTGWGRLSSKLLDEITDVDPKSGSALTIIEAMYEGQENLMELLSDKHGYMQKIRTLNAETEGTSSSLTYKLVRDSYASPAVKRGVWQTLLIVDEIRKFYGKDPSRVFIEVAREKEKNRKRTTSRKQQLIDLFKNIKDESRDWCAEINKRDEREFSAKKLFLYYLQNGKDIYSGEPISLEELFSKNAGGDIYDIDHIIPQSKKKDDSLLDNLVLTRSSNNGAKGNQYPVPERFRTKELKVWWRSLLENKFITKEKYNRLTRSSNNPLTEEELVGFIGRQLVETRQTTKLVAEILTKVVSKSKIIYSKANLVSEFRRDNGFWKSRLVNDYHHAKDAYLNIVVGNVYYSMFSNPYAVVRNVKGYSLRLDSLFGYKVKNGRIEYESKSDNSDFKKRNKAPWVFGEDGSIVTVRKFMAKNNIFFTRYATEKNSNAQKKDKRGFWRQQPSKRNENLMPLKTKDSRLDPGKYGGYDNIGISHFMLVESKDKKGLQRTLEAVPRHLSHAPEDVQLEYLRKRSKSCLESPAVLIPIIKMNSLLKIDGAPMHISGKSDERILVKNAVQLCVSPKEEAIFHKIEKYMERFKENDKAKIDICHDGLCSEDIIFLYESLENKSNERIYSMCLGSEREKIKKFKQSFLELDLEEQCIILCKMVELFHCRGGKKGIGSAKTEFRISKKLSPNVKSARLVYQSVTGLYENEIDLLTVKADE